ncbi:MAG: glutamate--tRNA ligase [Coriobacteriia bacterium]|nr:glutamate--tRNA ligase [Coriobacteriia bacterium]
MSERVRVRFAPSPTGHLHIGGARTAIYNWAFARRHGGTFVLRIDDTDPERSTQENTAAIMSALRWLGIQWDEGPEVGGDYGPYFQTRRHASYSAALEHLKAAGAVYPCFCSAEDLQSARDAARAADGSAGYARTCRTLPAEDTAARVAAGEPHTWRLKVRADRGDVVFDDAVRGESTFSSDVLDDFIVVRSDGTPTYNFATVVDDAEMEITHIIRGDDHLSNTPRQILVYEALGAPIPVFAHLSMIWGPDGKRLSKRHGAANVEDYRDLGILPEALVNYLALLGWSLDDKTTIIDAETLTASFSLERVSKNPAVFDAEKLEWMNGVYLRKMTADQFVDRMVPLLTGAGFMTGEDAAQRRLWLLELAPLLSDRVKRLDEIVPMVAFLFTDTVTIEEDARAKILEKEGALAALDATAEALGALGDFSPPAIEEALRSVPETTGIKTRLVFQAVRVAVTGSTVSLPLFESLSLLGKERSLDRIRAASSSLAD